MSRTPGTALLPRSRTIGLGNTGPVTAGTQHREPAATPPFPPLAAAELDRLRTRGQRGPVRVPRRASARRSPRWTRAWPPSSTRSARWPRAASGCAPPSPTGAGAAPAIPARRRGRGGRAARRRGPGVRARQRPRARRRHGRRAHPARPAGHPHRLRRPARRRRTSTATGELFGTGAAILVGDLALVWSDELLRRSGLSAAALTRARAVWDTMRTEVTAGQYLDLLRAAGGLPGARRRPDRGPLQERRLHRAAPAAARRGHRRRRPARSPRRTPRSGCRSARPSSCATTSSACSATRPSPASPPTTTCARASRPC